MEKKVLKILFFVSAVCFVWSCASINGSSEVQQVTSDMPTEVAMKLGFKYGGKPFEDAKKLAKKRKEFKLVAKIAEEALLGEKEPAGYMWRAMQVYQGINRSSVSPKVVGKLIESDDEFVRRMGWQLAANRPSDLVGVVLNRYLTESVRNGLESQSFLPEMASAVRANKLVSSYSIVREALYEKGGAEFVTTMIEFNSSQAGQDFMTYLSKATVEDLRQMTQTTVDLASCLEILRFYNEVELPLGHPSISHIYLYAVSRNNSLAELAIGALERAMGDHRMQLAFSLAKMPVWIQVAFVENAREQLDNSLGLFLTELKQVTSHAEVVEEIEALSR